MNGGIEGLAGTVHSSVQRATATGSKKRKRGLAPKREQIPAPVELAGAAKQSKSASKFGAPEALQNGHSDEKQTAADINGGSKGTCSMCGTIEPHTTVNLSANEVMRHTLLSYWQLPAQSLDSTLSSLCVQCVYKINAHKEITRSLTIRLHRLSSRQMGKVARQQPAQCVETAATVASRNDSSCCLNSTAVLTPESVRASDDTVDQQLHLSTSSPLPPLPTDTSYAKQPLLDAGNLTSPPYSPQRCYNGEADSEGKVPPDDTAKSETPRREAYVVQVEDITPVKEPRSSLQVQKLKDEGNKPTTPVPEVKLALLHPVRTLSLGSNSGSISPSLGGTQQSMLQVVRERSELALATESGGTINNYKRAQSLPQQLVCQYCSRVYWRKFFFAKHMRHCVPRNWHQTRAKSMGTSVRSRKSAPVAETLSATQSEAGHTDRLEQTLQFAKRVFHCPECAVTVETQGKLREHKRIHLQRFYCDSCGTEFTAYHDYDFHRVVCEAKQEALKQTATEADKTEQVGRQTVCTSVRVTRSRSRAASRAATTYTSVSNDSYRCIDAENELSDDEQETDDDAESVVDTMYTKRMRFTGNWVQDHSSSNSYLSLCDYDDDIQITTYKEYDLYLLDRLKLQVNLKCLTCFVPNCGYSTGTLLEMMVHDYANHFKRAWFYCQKCGCSFTSKVFLDYHLDRQNGGRFICFKCGDNFEFQHQLDRHLIRHTKCINYRCNYCNFEFLTENELLQHCDCEQHDPNGERKLIEIDPDMTIVNVVPAVPSHSSTHRRRIYAVNTLNMHLPQTGTKRPMEQPGYKPYRRKIGDVEFKNQKHPNCRGWK